MKTDIAYIISHGFAARMVMQTNLLGLLVQEGKNVVLVAPDKEDENLKNYCDENGVKLCQFNPKSNFWNAQYYNARKYFLEDIKANPALWEKHIYSIKYNKSKNPWKHILPRLLIIIYYLCQWFPSLKKWYKQREEKYLESEEALVLIKKINPRIIVSTYPVNFIEAMLLKAAKQQNAKTILHLLSWDNISCKGHFPQLADEYITWGTIMKEELIEYYNISKDKIHVCGVAHFDLHIESKQNPKPEQYLKGLGLKIDKPYLFFGMSSPRFAPKEIDIVEWIAKEVRNNIFGEEMQLIIRPHPQNVQGGMADQSWLPRLNNLHGNRVGVDFPDLIKSKMPWSMKQKDMKRLSQLISGCSVSLNSGSTLSIDAMMCSVPVILTSFDGEHQLNYWASARRLIDFIHLKKLVQDGGVSVVQSYEEMTSMLLNYINDPNYNLERRNYSIERECSNNQDLATKKIIDQLLTISAIKKINYEQN